MVDSPWFFQLPPPRRSLHHLSTRPSPHHPPLSSSKRDTILLPTYSYTISHNPSMPPRRSTRTSLPTPAQSSKAESVTSTPGKKTPSVARDGLLTPSSITDLSDTSLIDDVVLAEPYGVKVERELNDKVSVMTGTKRKGASNTNSVHVLARLD